MDRPRSSYLGSGLCTNLPVAGQVLERNAQRTPGVPVSIRSLFRMRSDKTLG